jgi:hypothetical protein
MQVEEEQLRGREKKLGKTLQKTKLSTVKKNHV